MRKFIAGLLVGLLLATAGISFAADPIRLIVNGQEIIPDVSPRLIDGRVMVPARFIAEPLGATVEWDAIKNAVVITSVNNHSVSNNPQDAQSEQPLNYQDNSKSDNEWLRVREVVELTGWYYRSDGYFTTSDGKILFHYSEVEHKIENGMILIHRNVLQRY